MPLVNGRFQPDAMVTLQPAEGPETMRVLYVFEGSIMAAGYHGPGRSFGIGHHSSHVPGYARPRGLDQPAAGLFMGPPAR